MFALNPLARVMLLAVALGVSSAHAAKIPIGFLELTGPVPETSEAYPPLMAEADRAIRARYGAEIGFRTTRSDAVDHTKIVVITSHLAYSRAIWQKMQLNGDATYEGGIAYFVFQSLNEPVSSYVRIGSLYLDQGASGYLRFWQNAFIQNYMISVHRDCSVSTSRVVAADPTVSLQPTAIVRTERVGNYFRYHYSVNGGAGARLSAIGVAFAPSTKLLLITNCEATVYLETNSSGPVPAGSPQP